MINIYHLEMAELKSKEIIQAEELISKGKTEEALEIVRKFQQTAWFHFSRIESDKALEIAMQSKELLEKIGKEIDLANNSYLIGHIYLQKGDFKNSLEFGYACVELQEKINNQPQKLTRFIEKVRETTSLWETLDKFSKTSQVAELKDIPVVESLISEIFSDKTSFK